MFNKMFYTFEMIGAIIKPVLLYEYNWLAGCFRFKNPLKKLYCISQGEEKSKGRYDKSKLEVFP